MLSAQATTTIAHLIDPDRRGADVIAAEGLLFAEMHFSVEYLGTAFNLYEGRMLGTSTALQTWIPTRWEHAFEFPWITDKT